MTVTNPITIAAPPQTTDVASQILTLMAGLNGVVTDYNAGSQIRTIAESVGSVNEQQGVWAQALAYQALIESALSLFGISVGAAAAASGIVQFSTGTGVPPAATQDVAIPLGTIVQTNGGTQFQTTQAVTLVNGTTSINAPIQAVVAGAAGNVPANAIINIVTGLVYPLSVTNPAATTGGADAQSQSASLAEFTALVSSIGLSSPVAIANAAIGVSFGSEQVLFSTLYEPWLISSGAGAGWQLYLDNGTGTASSGLIAAVNAKITGGTVSGASNASGAIGYRDAGVPYGIFAVTPTVAVVGVSGSLIPGANATLVSGAIAAAVSGYFTLPFGQSAEQANIAASAANAALGQLSGLTVSLYASGSGTPLTALTTSPSGRVILGSLSVSVS